jgi:hypothetical protein
LDELSREEGRALTLATVPDREWDRVASLGFDAVWLMGVWERSHEGIRIATMVPAPEPRRSTFSFVRPPARS